MQHQTSGALCDPRNTRITRKVRSDLVILDRWSLNVWALFFRVIRVFRGLALGPEHPAVANALQNLAKVYFQQQRYGEADELYGRAVAIMEKSLGPDHPDLAQTLDRYALLLEKTKRKSESSAMKARAKAILVNNPAIRSGNQTIDVRDLDRESEASK